LNNDPTKKNELEKSLGKKTHRSVGLWMGARARRMMVARGEEKGGKKNARK